MQIGTPFKRFPLRVFLPSTWLKPGVNKSKESKITFEASHPNFLGSNEKTVP